MSAPNPYRCPERPDSELQHERLRSRQWWSGFAIGATPPAAFAVYSYLDFRMTESYGRSLMDKDDAFLEFVALLACAPLCGLALGFIARRTA